MHVIHCLSHERYFPFGPLTLTGNARRFEMKRWHSDDTPEPIKKIAQIMIQQLNKRFKLEGIPDASTPLAMKLNPTVSKVRDLTPLSQPGSLVI